MHFWTLKAPPESYFKECSYEDRALQKHREHTYMIVSNEKIGKCFFSSRQNTHAS